MLTTSNCKDCIHVKVCGISAEKIKLESSIKGCNPSNEVETHPDFIVDVRCKYFQEKLDPSIKRPVL